MSDNDAWSGSRADEEDIRVQAQKEVERKIRGKTFPAPNSAMRLDFVEAFVAAADQSSIKEAALSLRVSEETLRKRIDAFEKWSNTKLFQRKPYLLMTPDAADLLPHARSMCVSLREMQKFIRGWQVRAVVWPNYPQPKNGELRRVNIDGRSMIEID